MKFGYKEQLTASGGFYISPYAAIEIIGSSVEIGKSVLKRKNVVSIY